jgi:hypothetical protein
VGKGKSEWNSDSSLNPEVKRIMEKRKSQRNKAYAKILLEGSNIRGYLRDLSEEGCQLALLKALEIQKGDRLAITVLPGEEIGIPAFSMPIEVMWSRPDPVYYLLGAQIGEIEEKEGQLRLRELSAYYHQ